MGRTLVLHRCVAGPAIGDFRDHRGSDGRARLARTRMAGSVREQKRRVPFRTVPRVLLVRDCSSKVSLVTVVLECSLRRFVDGKRVGSHGDAFWREEFPLMVAWAFGR